jgi:hypothetical protein
MSADTPPADTAVKNDHDSPWKEALERFFPEFLALLFPAIHAEIDWIQGAQFLDKEFQQIVREKANPEKKLMRAVGAASAVTEHAANWAARLDPSVRSG